MKFASKCALRYKVHSIEGEERVSSASSAWRRNGLLNPSSNAAGGKVVRISAPYIVSKDPAGKTRIKGKCTEIGGDEFVVMADRVRWIRKGRSCKPRKAAKAGAKMLRGGAFKPPFAVRFSGHGRRRLKLLQKAKKATGGGHHGRMSDRDVDLVRNTRT